MLPNPKSAIVNGGRRVIAVLHVYIIHTRKYHASEAAGTTITGDKGRRRDFVALDAPSSAYNTSNAGLERICIATLERYYSLVLAY